jgi:hypothetical protein
MKYILIWVLFCGSLLLMFVHSKPTIYKKNENDKLEPGKIFSQFKCFYSYAYFFLFLLYWFYKLLEILYCMYFFLHYNLPRLIKTDE